MCNGNVAPKHMGRPANPHQWRQTRTQTLAFRYVATLTDRIIKLKIKISLLTSVIWTQEVEDEPSSLSRVLLALVCASDQIYINSTMKKRV